MNIRYPETILEAMRSAKPFVVLGAGGMLGRAWCELLQRKGYRYIGHDIDTLDLTQSDQLAQLADMRPAWVVNCAAYTDVDGAESEPEKAHQLNATVPADLARLCRDIDATLIHYSTDYVFGGSSDKPRRVEDPKSPMGVYGRTKLAGEEAIRSSDAGHLIVRTSWLYAPWGRNFVRTIAGAAAQRDTLRVVNDQRGRPTSAEHLAEASLQLLTRDQQGTFHVTDGGQCTWFDFAQEIVRLTGARCTVEPCTSEEYPRPAKRPAYSVLDIRKTQEQLGPLPDWPENLADVICRLEPAESRS